jgi:chromosome segregation ATPase
MSIDSVRARAWPRVIAGATLALSLAALAQQQGTVKNAINEQVGTEQAAKQTQDKIDGLDDETRKGIQEYRALIQENDSLKRYNDQLALQIKSQEEEMQNIATELSTIEQTSREIVPLVQKMLTTLGEFVKLDLPFAAEERAKRIASLNEMMGRADVSIAEKYRRIVEAYQIEMEYGRTIEETEEKVGDKTVQMLRVGRIALLYQSLDGNETGYWDVDQKKWVEDNSYRDAVRRGIKIAKKQGAPDLLIVPVHAATEAK